MKEVERLSVMHCIAPGSFGGLESVVRSLAEGTLALHHDVRVAAVVEARDGTHPYVRMLEEAEIPVTPIALPSRAYLRECRQLAHAFASYEPALVHTHGYRSDVLAGAVARHRGIATVSTVHGFTGGDRKNRFYERLQRRAFRKCDAVVAVSRPIEALLLGDGVSRERVHLIQNAIPNIRGLLSREAARRELGVPVEGARIGWVGRLSAEKGIDLMVEAVARVGTVDVAVSIVGEGPMRQAMEERANVLGLTGVVRWHGTVMNAARLLRAFDLIVLSSRTEGTPIVLLEAMQAGLPVVATAVGGVPDALSDAEGWLVAPERPDDLARVILDALADATARGEKGRAAALRYARDFAPEPWLKRYEEMYRAVLSSERDK